MLDKAAFYHGAAIIPILEEEQCRSIRKLELLGAGAENEADWCKT